MVKPTQQLKEEAEGNASLKKAKKLNELIEILANV